MTLQQTGSSQGTEQPGAPSTRRPQMDASQPATPKTTAQETAGQATLFRDFASI
ncbi:hypothetical protein [Rubellimicrobium arenae]|uniref:hypothetical protein n=1 Tax=Rubellimicrobium arenae TaxID=2817372 RepID=UPI001B314A1F|nr:hypothetical protein [Rubellimicrobium arenae]